MKRGGRSMGLTFAMAITGIIGVAFLIVTFFAFSSYRHNQKVCTGRVYGTVVDLVEHTYTSTSNGHRRTGYTYAPVVQYMANGREYTVESRTSSNPPAYAVGDMVEVHYNPDNPEESFFDKDSLVVVLGVVFGAVGVAMCVISVAIFVLSKMNII